MTIVRKGFKKRQKNKMRPYEKIIIIYLIEESLLSAFLCSLDHENTY
jgi:hypothetical protein